ncbi:MAG: sec-independent protein translocase protein TatA [Myxococcota bacterium]|jgi:sec-independent protein translocase protein TatA
MSSDQTFLNAIGLGIWELLLILVIVLLIFGAGKLPQIGDALGRGIRNFKSASTKADDAVDVTPKALDAAGTTAARTVDVETTDAKKS